jgi:hypothetical protein
MEFFRENRFQYRVNNAGNNFFTDGKYLAEGYFPQLIFLKVYSTIGGEGNNFAETSFPSKMQTHSLHWLRKLFPYADIRARKFSFQRSIHFSLLKRWKDIAIQ